MSKLMQALALVALAALSAPLSGQGVPTDPGAGSPLLPRTSDEGAEDLPGEWNRPVPAGFHLGSFSNTLAARLGRDGVLDSGAVLLDLFDPDASASFVPERIAYGRGPTLTVLFEGRIAGFAVTAIAGADATRGEDQRVVAALQLRLVNDSTETRTGTVMLRLRPGDVDDPLARPFGALPFHPGTEFGEQDGFITRDGRAVAAWTGPVPELQIRGVVDQPTDVGASLAYPISLPPGGITYLEARIAGPGVDGPRNEDKFRAAFRRRSLVEIEEVLRWQWEFRGVFTAFMSGVGSLQKTIAGNIHFLRSLGAAQYQVRSLSDRPYGHPARDAAAEAEVLGALMIVGLADILIEKLDAFHADLDALLASLSPERRVALLYGLVQGMRLAPHDPRKARVAQAVLDHVETVAVRPWWDPDVVRRDFVEFVRGEGLSGVDDIPSLTWAEVEDADSVAGRMLACRRALSDGLPDEAWVHYAALMERGTVRGMGAYDGSHELDGRYSLGMLNLLRAMLVDDHGPDLVYAPLVPNALVQRLNDLSFNWTPTRYGRIRGQIFYAGRRIMGAWVRRMPGIEPERILVGLPPGITPRRLFGKPTGGEGQVLDDGRIRVWIDRESAEGLRLSFNFGGLGLSADESDDADDPEGG